MVEGSAVERSEIGSVLEDGSSVLDGRDRLGNDLPGSPRIDDLGRGGVKVRAFRSVEDDSTSGIEEDRAGRDRARRRLDPTSTTNPEPHRLDTRPTRRVEDDPHPPTGEGSRPLPPAHAPVGGPRGVYLITNSRIFWVFTRLVW